MRAPTNAQWSYRPGRRLDRSGGLPIPRLRLRLLRLIPLVVRAQIETRAEEVDLVLADLVAQHAPRRTVMLERHRQFPCKIPQS